MSVKVLTATTDLNLKRLRGKAAVAERLHPDDALFSAKALIRRSGFTPTEIEAVQQLVGHTIAALERELILETLARRSGNRTQAANILGISIRGLRNKIRAYKVDGKDASRSKAFVRRTGDVDIPSRDG